MSADVGNTGDGAAKTRPDHCLDCRLTVTDSLDSSSLRAGIDIGGTFTDLVVYDDASGAFVVGKTLTTPDDPSRRDRGRAGGDPGVRERGDGCPGPDHPRHDAGHQRADRAQGRADRAAGQRGVPRFARDRPRASLRPLRPAAGDAASPGAARAALRRAGAHPGRRLDPPGARSGRGVCRAPGARAGRGRDRGGRHRLPQQLRQPRAGATRAGGRAARRAGYPRLDLVRRGAGDPRVRAHLDDRRQCLRPGPGRALPARSGGAAGAGGIPRRAVAADLLRRAGHGRDGRALPGAAAGERSGRGSAGRRGLRRRGRLRGPPFLRYGGHHRQVRGDRPRRAAAGARLRGRPPLPLQEGLRAADQPAGDRDDRDRRRRRLDRAHRRARSAQGRARLRGRRSRAGLLRPRRRAADRHRCRSGPRLPRSRLLPRRRDVARRRRRRARPSAATSPSRWG